MLSMTEKSVIKNWLVNNNINQISSQFDIPHSTVITIINKFKNLKKNYSSFELLGTKRELSNVRLTQKGWDYFLEDKHNEKNDNTKRIEQSEDSVKQIEDSIKLSSTSQASYVPIRMIISDRKALLNIPEYGKKDDKDIFGSMIHRYLENYSTENYKEEKGRICTSINTQRISDFNQFSKLNFSQLLDVLSLITYMARIKMDTIDEDNEILIKRILDVVIELEKMRQELGTHQKAMTNRIK